MFLFKRAKIKVGIERDKDGVYDDKNEVKRIVPLDECPPAPKPSAATQAAKPQPRPPAKPWHAGDGRRPPSNRRSGRKLHRESREANRPIDSRLSDKYAAALREKHARRSGEKRSTRPCSSCDHTSVRRSTRSTPIGQEQGSGNPLLSLATATGKVLLIAWLIRDAISKYPNVRVLCLVHVQELIEQNVKHLLALWPDAPLGINCAALGRRDWDQQIIFASIQTVFRSPERLGRRHLVLIDECHLVPHDGDGMYRTTLERAARGAPEHVGVRFLATPFRLDSGYLTEGDDKIFDEVIFDYDIGRGIADGWLSPLSSKATKTTIDVRDVGRRGGEFIAGELEAAADHDAIDRRRLRRDRRARRRAQMLAGFLLRHRSCRARARRAARARCYLRGSVRRDAAGRARADHRGLSVPDASAASSTSWC